MPGWPTPGAKVALLHMNPDLTRLIRLQQLETAADDARRKIADHPARTQALDARLQGARDAVAGMKAKLAASSEKRRVEEKEVAGVQTRLAKYKDQLLEVKTNREYTAMLHEIETAQNDIRTREDRILEIMMETDELNAAIKKSEAELKAAEKEVAAERAVLDAETAGLQAEIDKTMNEMEMSFNGSMVSYFMLFILSFGMSMIVSAIAARVYRIRKQPVG